MTPADEDSWDEIGLEPGDLPTGVIVGMVEVVGCRKVRGEYEWDLARTVRLKRQLKAKKHPQPAWFNPFPLIHPKNCMKIKRERFESQTFANALSTLNSR
jgi:hypothetical protein